MRQAIRQEASNRGDNQDHDAAARHYTCRQLVASTSRVGAMTGKGPPKASIMVSSAVSSGFLPKKRKGDKAGRLIGEETCSRRRRDGSDQQSDPALPPRSIARRPRRVSPCCCGLRHRFGPVADSCCRCEASRLPFFGTWPVRVGKLKRHDTNISQAGGLALAVTLSDQDISKRQPAGGRRCSSIVTVPGARSSRETLFTCSYIQRRHFYRPSSPRQWGCSGVHVHANEGA